MTQPRVDKWCVPVHVGISESVFATYNLRAFQCICSEKHRRLAQYTMEQTITTGRLHTKLMRGWGAGGERWRNPWEDNESKTLGEGKGLTSWKNTGKRTNEDNWYSAGVEEGQTGEEHKKPGGKTLEKKAQDTETEMTMTNSKECSWKANLCLAHQCFFFVNAGDSTK